MPSRLSSRAPTLAEDTGVESALHVIGPLATQRMRLAPRRDVITRLRHDLGSLVHSVVGYSDLLTEPAYGSLSPEQARFVGYVRSSASQLQELVETCLELSQPDNDQFSLPSPAAPVGQLLRRVHNTLVERGALCGLTLAAGLETRVVNIEVAQLERALLGLLQVLSHDSGASVTLAAALSGDLLVLSLRADACPEQTEPSFQLTELESEVGNRDFIRLKLSELLVTRADGVLRLSKTLDVAHVSLPLQG